MYICLSFDKVSANFERGVSTKKEHFGYVEDYHYEWDGQRNSFTG